MFCTKQMRNIHNRWHCGFGFSVQRTLAIVRLHRDSVVNIRNVTGLGY